MVHWLYANEIIGVNEIVPENNLILSSGNFIGGETGWIWITENSENGWTKFGNLIKDHIKPTFMVNSRILCHISTFVYLRNQCFIVAIIIF